MGKVIKSLHRLERDIPGKSVGDRDIDPTAIELSAFDIPNVVQRQLGEDSVGDPRCFGPL